MPKKWKSKKMIPLDVIQTWLKDPDWRVRTAAIFDISDEECSTGYHFFCTREEAEAY
jgi:hypothetical protein